MKTNKKPQQNPTKTKHTSKDTHTPPSPTANTLPSLSRSLSGLALGPVSDQSPLNRKRLTGGCRNWGKEREKGITKLFMLDSTEF